jgi:hypothetical protein
MKLKKIKKINLLNIYFLFFMLFIFVYFYYVNIKEGLNNMYIDNNLSTNFSDSFCESIQLSGNELKQSCQKLTQNNCRSTSCCIWKSNEKCDAGGKDGLLFNTDSNGKVIPLDYYYYKDTCYGKKCP